MTALKAPLTFFVLLATLGLMAGCQRVHVGPDASAMADVPCGPTTCTDGQVCCNASCGVCTEPGEGCIAIACTMDCAANNDCESTEYCAFSHCADGTNDGVCVPRPMECTEEFAPVCGCDGATHSNECSANSAGVVAARIGECSDPPPMCAAQDIRGDGPCAAGYLGAMWDGMSCRWISGCSCVGADCGSMYTSLIECEDGQSGCHSCAAQDAAGEGSFDEDDAGSADAGPPRSCVGFYGVFWNGTSCNVERGCECVGADCMNGWSWEGPCDAAHFHCRSTSTCTTNAGCSILEFCSRPEGVCAGTGTCERYPGADGCPPIATPVCGCDGVEYACATAANIHRVSVAHEGACEPG